MDCTKDNNHSKSKGKASEQGFLTQETTSTICFPPLGNTSRFHTSSKEPYSTASLMRPRHFSIGRCTETISTNCSDWSSLPKPNHSNVYATLSRDPKRRLATGKLTLPLRTGSEPPPVAGRKASQLSSERESLADSSSRLAPSGPAPSPSPPPPPPVIVVGELTFDVTAAATPCRPEDLRLDRELGQGACGVVSAATHLPTGRRLALKAMRLHHAEQRRRALTDLEVARKCSDCRYVVQFYGALVCQSEVWICMELMAACLERLARCSPGRSLSEPVLGKVTVPVLRALSYLKERHSLIHRDVKPSNILVSWSGCVKLADFGITGVLVDSQAHTRTAGCLAYLAPERITLSAAYDVRSDIWSLGVTLVELATGRHPLAGCSCEMELLTRIVDDPPPRLPRVGPGYRLANAATATTTTTQTTGASSAAGAAAVVGAATTRGATFSDHFRDFVDKCLAKDVNLRPKYRRLLCHDFVKYHEQTQTDLAEWLAELMAHHPELSPDSVANVRRRRLSAASSQGSSSGYGSADTSSPLSTQS